MRTLMLTAILAVTPAALIHAQEQPPTAPPAMRVIAEVKFCKVEIPTECRTVEMVPAGGREATTLMDCMRGLAMGSAAEFTYEGERWQTKGGTCKEEHNDYAAWRQAQTRK